MLFFMLFYVCILSMTIKTVDFALILAWTIITTHRDFKQGDVCYLCGSLASCSSDWSN